ncbi:hypothetical protein CTI12_AA226230 [Artemisia annua]|uniref:Uncharacterized protein n=1 Tax=Artemisia annua TaxID=35608 RepID=A0A2U1NQD8_ARTAN|nr:hypothetical protein CTI12_AA226230 [Artemisia annua]
MIVRTLDWVACDIDDILIELATKAMHREIIAAIPNQYQIQSATTGFNIGIDDKRPKGR